MKKRRRISLSEKAYHFICDYDFNISHNNNNNKNHWGFLEYHQDLI